MVVTLYTSRLPLAKSDVPPTKVTYRAGHLALPGPQVVARFSHASTSLPSDLKGNGKRKFIISEPSTSLVAY